MRTGNDGAALRGLATLQTLGALGHLTDGQLLERFATGTGEAAELAFEALVDRHGSMVLRVCRALLSDSNDAQDAYQATFLVLVRKARGLWVRDSLGPWLHQVARRAALRARSTAARNRTREQTAAQRTAEAQAPDPRAGFELEEALHDEINRLPDRYRIPIILCDLQGLSCEEAARRLNRPVGTVKSWRSRGRDRLRSRLTQRGLAPSAGVFVPLDAAIRLVPPWRTAGTVSASAQSLAQGVLKTMFLHKLKLAATAALALTLAAGGFGAVALGVADDPPKPDPKPQAQAAAPVPEPEADDEVVNWMLPLQEAIRLGLANADFGRVVSQPGGREPLKIVAKGDMDEAEFQAKTTELVVWIERSYWELGRRLVAIPPTERAVARVQEVLNREEARSDAGESDGKNVDEIWRRLKALKRELTNREAGAAEADRQLRGLLGFSENDGLKAIPVTDPTEKWISWDWKGWEENTAKNLTEAERARVENQELKVSDLYRQLQRASLNHRATLREFEEDRERYESRRGALDDYLKTITGLARSAQDEIDLRHRYNIAIAEFGQLTGTLLDRHQIAIAGEPQPTPAPAEPKEIEATEETAGKTYSFHFSIGAGPRPFEIRGSLTVAPAR